MAEFDINSLDLSFLKPTGVISEAGAFKKDGEIDPQEQALREQLASTLVAQVADEQVGRATARASAVEAEVGTKGSQPIYVTQPGERVVATFGKVKARKEGDKTIIENNDVPVPQAAHQLDLSKTTDAIVNNTKTFDIEGEFKKMREMTDLGQKEQAAQLLYMNMGQQASVVQQRIRQQAAQRAGVFDAEAALNKNIQLDAAAVAAGRIRVGDTTTQTEEAKLAYSRSLTAANQLETDLLKSDPEFQKLNDYRNLLQREFGQIDRSQAKAEALEAQLPVLTDSRLANARFALGIKETNTAKLQNAIGKSLLKDKALQQVIDATKEDFPKLLVHPDQNVRRYAYNIIEGFERKNLNLSDTDKLPEYVTQLQKLVNDREALLSANGKRAIAKPTTATGEKERGENRTAILYRDLAKQIEDTTALKYKRMDLWSFQDPQFKKVVDGVRVNNKDNKVLLSDGLEAIMSAKILNQDGSEMRPEQKIEQAIASLKISMQNDQGSAILPSVQNYLGQFATEVRNTAMRIYVQQQARKGEALDYRAVTGIRGE